MLLHPTRLGISLHLQFVALPLLILSQVHNAPDCLPASAAPTSLSVHPPMCPYNNFCVSVRPHVCLYVHLFVCQSVFPYVHPSIRPPVCVCPRVCRYVNLSFRMSTCPYSIHPPLCLYVHVSVGTSIHLSLCPPHVSIGTSISLSACPPVHTSTCVSVCSRVCQYVNVSFRMSTCPSCMIV